MANSGQTYVVVTSFYNGRNMDRLEWKFIPQYFNSI